MTLDPFAFERTLREAVDTATDDARLRALLLEAVGSPRPTEWEEIPYWCGRAAGGASDAQQTLIVCLALWRAASSILDDIQDEDTHHALWRRIGAGAASNVSLALVFTAFQLLGRLVQDGVPTPVVIEAYQRLAHTGVMMTAAQDQQLATGRSLDDLSLEDYHTLVCAKTVAFCVVGTELAARIAGAPPDFVAAAAALGSSIGRMHQALGDYSALDSEDGKRDIGHVPTYPVLYAYRVASPIERARLQAAWSEGREADVRRIAIDLGAAHFLTLQLSEEVTALHSALASLRRSAKLPQAIARLQEIVLPLVSLPGPAT